MRTLLFALGFFLLAVSGRADDFPTDFPPTFKFHETYKDVVIPDPDFPGDFITDPRGDLLIQAVASLSGYDLNQIDYSTPFGIAIGDFEETDNVLADDDDFDPTDPTHNRSVTVSFDGIDSDGNPIQAGQYTVLWSSARVTITFTSHNATDQETVATSDYYPDVVDPAIDREDLTVEFFFGPFDLNLRTVYMIGSASTSTDDRVDDDLSNVVLDGAMDSVPPTVTITAPAINANLTVNDSPNGFFNISGTVADTRAVNGITFPGTVNGVQVKLGDTATDGTFVDAQLDGNGNWVLPNAPIIVGKNFLTVQAFDADGNTTVIATRSFKYSLQGQVTVTTSATGYAPTDAGRIAGTVSGSFLKVASKKLTMLVGSTAPQDTTTQTAGNPFILTATPGVNSVFNGWTGVINGTTVLSDVNARLQFDARPDMTLTADFVPNPFSTAIVGKYQGLITGGTVGERGSLNLTLTKTGAFTAVVKLGAVVLPIKGKVLGSGLWQGTVTKAGKVYTINLNLNVGVTGEREIAGTVTATGINSTLTADLNTWKKKTTEATAYVGSYTVLLPASINNDDTSFPLGVGYGRVTIGKLGTVLFVGKLADGSPFVATATLAKLTTGEVSFPLFIPLYRSLGNVSGKVTYDNTQPDSDLTSTLEWTKPLTTGNEPQPFEGEIAMNGSLYTKPASFAILGPSSGAGTMTLTALPFSKPTKMIPSSLGPTLFAVTLLSNNTFTSDGKADVSKVKFKINAATGLFTGSYFDSDFKRAIPFTGAVSQKANMAGGIFIRGNRVGEVTLTP